MKSKHILSYLKDKEIYCSSITDLDIYIPSFNLSIEEIDIKANSFNNGREKNYFYKRMQFFNNQGIDYCFFWNFEFKKWNIIESFLNNYFNQTLNKISVKKCIMRKLTVKEEKEFFNNNHIDGYEKSNLAYGLVYENDIVSAISFKTSTSSTKLIRYCDKLNYKIIGGFEKLLTTKPENLPLYATQDRRFGKNNRFLQLQFNQIKTVQPNEFFINDDYTGFIKTRKNTDTIFDCGSIIWEKI